MKTTTKAGQTTKTVIRTETVYSFDHIAKFKPHGIVTYGKFTSNSTAATQTNAKSLANLEKPNEEGYNGYMSPTTGRNVKGIIENFLTAVELNTDMKFPFVKGEEKPLDKVYPTFVTLTLPFKQMHDDNDVKREIFTPFMQEMIRNWNVKCYVWVMETQENGNVHFHVLMDRGIPALRLREIWNKHLNKMPFEYVNCYQRIQKKIYEKGYVFREEMLEKRIEKERIKAREEKRKFTQKDKTEVKKKEDKRQREVFQREIAKTLKIDKNLSEAQQEAQKARWTAYCGTGGFVLQQSDYEAALKAEGKRLDKQRLTQDETWQVKKAETARQRAIYDTYMADAWTNPNSTDIHAIQNIKKLTAYVTKYFTKKPELVKPTLNKNEKWIELEGKFYIEKTHTTADLDSIIYDPKNKVEIAETYDDDGVMVTTVTERIEQKPVFKNRKMFGRIWGTAEALKDPATKPCPYQLSLKTWVHAKEITQCTNSRPQVVRVEKGRDIFGGAIYAYETHQITHQWEESEDKKYTPHYHKEANEYIKKIKEIVPKTDIELATLKAGAMFASQESNRVIPLKEPQKGYLAEHSPPLWAAYKSHYTNIFNTLYPTNAAA